MFQLIATLQNREEPKASWEGTYRELITGGRGGILVAEHEGNVIGVITYSFNLAIRYSGEYAQIEELIVDPAARGLSAGKALVEGCIDEARRRGCEEIGLYVVNPDNMPFYARFGFRDVGPEVRMRLD